jgi:phosphoenolpyruvate---glycerone phosphotransferase subunit DhaL
MAKAGLATLERVVRTVASTAVENERYFGELDSVVGDGDFGYSMARGFEVVLSGWDGLDRSDPATFLRRIALIITSRMGGTSGPIWGTAFLRAATVVKEFETFDAATVIAMLRGAVKGIQDRGKAELGDKTLLDALVPAIDELERRVSAGASSRAAVQAASAAARVAADGTSLMRAMRGRASYSGERSVGSPDPGAVAVAVMLERIADTWPEVEPTIESDDEPRQQSQEGSS